MGRQIGAFFAERRTRFEEMFRHVCDCLGGAEGLDGRRLIAALAMSWLGIEDHESLRHSTMCGFPWLGNSADGTPIATFDQKRARLLYVSSIGEENGLTIDEYRFAEWFTRDTRTEAGYPDPAHAPKTGLAGFLSIAVRNTEFFRKDVIPHDRGFRRLIRRFGYSELPLVVFEVLALKTSRRKDMRHLRLDDAGRHLLRD